MEIRDDLLCLFSAEIESDGDSAIIEVPAEELGLGDLDAGGSYRIAIFEQEPTESRRERSTHTPSPPVSEGEEIDVEIESIGDQGDGIARVDRGYVIIVPETEVGDRVTVEITTVKENMAFAEVLEHHRVA